MNMFLLLGAAGLSQVCVFSYSNRHCLRSIYFACLDALNYACYQDSRFMLVGTFGHNALAPEGRAPINCNSTNWNEPKWFIEF